MIRYALKCSKGHQFDSWFRDSAAFETLLKSKQLTCTVCGTTKVEKTIMAPAVKGGKKVAIEEANPLSQPATPAEAALKKLRNHLRENSDYVGKEFASEARRIHDGDSDARSIWGEASKEDAESLKEDGIPVAPLPFVSRQDD